jgi:hypothetical protein
MARSVTVTIGAEQRDLLYGEVIARLPGIDSVWRAVERQDFEAADRLGWEYSDSLRLLVEDLGWGDRSSAGVELRTPPDVLRRSLERLRESAERWAADEAQERAETERRTRLLKKTCEEVLGLLDRGTVR